MSSVSFHLHLKIGAIILQNGHFKIIKPMNPPSGFDERYQSMASDFINENKTECEYR